MLRAVLAVAALAFAARADLPGIAIAPQVSLTFVPEEQACAGIVAPQPWHDASDPVFFATGPTARLDAQELWAGSLAPLLALRYAAGGLHVMVVGTPLSTQIHFTGLGWKPRWPFC